MGGIQIMRHVTIFSIKNPNSERMIPLVRVVPCISYAHGKNLGEVFLASNPMMEHPLCVLFEATITRHHESHPTLTHAPSQIYGGAVET